MLQISFRQEWKKLTSKIQSYQQGSEDDVIENVQLFTRSKIVCVTLEVTALALKSKDCKFEFVLLGDGDLAGLGFQKNSAYTDIFSRRWAFFLWNPGPEYVFWQQSEIV